MKIPNLSDHSFVDRFEYEQFRVNMTKQGMIDIPIEEYQVKQFLCLIENHDNNQIEGMCVNRECKSQNRRVCVECIQLNLHQVDCQLQDQDLFNFNQMENAIRQFKDFVDLQLDKLYFEFYYEQLKMTFDINDKIALIKQQHLEKIESQLVLTVKGLELLNTREYLEFQQHTNLGLFQYLIEYYKQIEQISQNIQDYKQFIQNIQVGVFFNVAQTQIQKFLVTKRERHLIIKKIQQTRSFKERHLGDEQKRTINQYIEELLELGRRLIFQEQFNIASQYFDLFISNNPNNYKAYLGKGICYHNLQLYQQAIQMYDIAMTLSPNNHLLYFSKGSSLSELQENIEAIKMYDIALQLDPNNYKYYNNKGYSFYQLDQNQEAMKMYDVALQLNPAFYEAFNNKGLSLSKLQKYDQAIKSYDMAIQIDPSRYIAYFNKAQTFSKMKLYDLSIMMYDYVLKLNPQCVKAYHNKGFQLGELSRHIEAIEMYNVAIKLNTEFREAFINKGDSLRSLQRHNEAIQMYDLALLKDPNDCSTMISKGITLEYIRQFEEAIAVYDRVIQINPKFHTAYIKKSQALKELQRFDEAALVLELANSVEQEIIKERIL